MSVNLTQQDVKYSILVLKGITKSFSGVKVLQDVDIEINCGEVHAVIGENGAGKSTLMKIISGIYMPDSGTIYYDNEVVKIKDPLDAKNKGIGLIHQEISNIPDLTVAENIFLGSLPLTNNKSVNWKKMNKDAKYYLDELDCDFNSTDIVGNLTIARQQMVEIAKALALKPKVIIFDEPTSSLSEQEKKPLFNIIRKLSEQGVAIIYISHRMDEIFEISDRITVL
ncbi:MAG: sugar ABC transporter ATP-binding protein, partial [Clostridiaceae bacterium]|nr:sugar ABC transporter ATP-binding protein [Clostridiaceae bacterium]